MNKAFLSALFLFAYPLVSMGAVEGQWTYIVENGGATITASTATGAVTIPSILSGLPVNKIDSGINACVFGINNTSVITLTIPNTVISIGNRAFGSCTGLVIVTIPSSVTSIGDNAFSNCSSLFTVNIAAGVISIGNNAFQGCTSLPSITIPSSVTSIGYATFSNCRALTSITIPNSVTSIDSAFQNCTALTSITIPNLVTSIANSAFQGCTSLTTVNLPSSVTSIGSAAFQSCTSLPSIIIPSSVTSIGSNAFGFCTSLTSIIIPSSVTSIADNAFNNCTSLTSITMPDIYIGQAGLIGLRGKVASDHLVNALANNDAFVTAVANKIKATGGNYGIATQSGLSSLIEPLATKTELAPLATKAELTSSLTQSRTDGINSVLSNPNLWTLYTTSQIQNMAVGDLVLTKNVGGSFTLNYDIEQSADLQTWTTYAPLSLPLTGLPTDRAFVRIKAK